MAAETGKPRPWLIAAWPGMGNVAVIAAGYLVHELGMEEAGELPSRDHFDINEVEVKGGIIERPRLPRGVFFRWTNPKQEGRDLIIFLGESQPASKTYAYAHELVATAKRMGAERVVTFASMASGLHPADNPKVTGVATDDAMLAELHRVEVQPLEEGQIGGLNGVVLGAAADQGIPGLCLLAEIPFFAAAVPNPKAARIALSVFSILAEIDIKLEALNKYSAAMDKALIEAMEKIEKKQEEEGGEFAIEEDDDDDGDEDEEESHPPLPAAKEPTLDYATRNRIERLFQEARRDKTKAMRLKEELDRLGVFEQYEDRFLDLFRRAE